MTVLFEILSSTILLFFNFFVACYTVFHLIRGFMLKNKLIYELEGFNSTVNQSQESWDSATQHIQNASIEIEKYLEKELEISKRNLTFQEKLTTILNKFSKLEDVATEYMGMNHNVRSIKTETPANINGGMKQILEKKGDRESHNILEQTNNNKITLKRSKLYRYRNTSKSVSNDQVQNDPIVNRFKRPILKPKINYVSDSMVMPSSEIKDVKKKLNEINKPLSCDQSWVVK